MADAYYVRPESLDDCASSMQGALEQFQSATDAAKKAAEELASMWEGDTRDTFVRKQEEREAMFQQMRQAVSDTLAFLKAVSARYKSTDLSCAKKVKV